MTTASSDETLTLAITETSGFQGRAPEVVVLRPVPIPEVVALNITETGSVE